MLKPRTLPPSQSLRLSVKTRGSDPGHGIFDDGHGGVDIGGSEECGWEFVAHEDSEDDGDWSVVDGNEIKERA